MHQVELDGEGVLYDRVTGRLHYLNWSGYAVWSRLDGKTSVPQLASALARAFDVDHASVEADIFQLVNEFGRQGLLAAAASGDRRAPLHR